MARSIKIDNKAAAPERPAAVKLGLNEKKPPLLSKGYTTRRMGVYREQRV